MEILPELDKTAEFFRNRNKKDDKETMELIKDIYNEMIKDDSSDEFQYDLTLVLMNILLGNFLKKEDLK
jgi:hypothetical protein